MINFHNYCSTLGRILFPTSYPTPKSFQSTMSSPTEETLLFAPSNDSYDDEDDVNLADEGYGSIYGRGGEDAVADDAEGHFRKHWHNTTEMIVVLTVIIVVRIAFSRRLRRCCCSTCSP
jgi:hypothetical protein